MGRGELYQVFIDLAQQMLKTPPSAVTEHGVYDVSWPVPLIKCATDLKKKSHLCNNSEMTIAVIYLSLQHIFPDVNVAFQQAAHKVLLDDDNLLPLLHLTIDYQGKDNKGIYH